MFTPDGSPSCCCLQNHFFAHYSTTLLANLYRTCFLFDVKFWLMDHVFAKFAAAIFGLSCYCACAETATVVLLALILYKIKFSVPGFLYNLSFDWFLTISWPLLVRMCRNSRETTSGVKFDLKIDFSVPDFLYDEKF